MQLGEVAEAPENTACLWGSICLWWQDLDLNSVELQQIPSIKGAVIRKNTSKMKDWETATKALALPELLVSPLCFRLLQELPESRRGL